MAIIGYMESSLATSEVFQDINNIDPKSKTTDKVINLIKTSKHVTNTDIEAAYVSILQVTDTLTREAVKAFNNGTLVLLYTSVPELRATQALPFITLKSGGSNKTYIFLDKYIKITRDGVMSIQPTYLRDLLISGLIANGIRNNYTKLAGSTYLQKALSDIYVKFVIRILNREFSIQADKVVYDTLQYWIAKFFLIRIMQATDSPENIERLASANFRALNELQVADIKQKYDDANPTKFSELLTLLRDASPRMKTLNRGTFSSDWVNYYHVPSMLAIDNVEYLIFMIITLQSGNNIISIAASDIVKEAKNLKGFREEMLKLVH